MYCPNCATQVHSGVKFCTRCGINLSAVSDIINGRAIEAPRSEEIMELMEKCHNGYLSTIIGLGLVIISLIVATAAVAFGITMAAVVGFIFLGWAIPAIAQGAGRWLSARNEIRSMLSSESGLGSEGRAQKSLPSEDYKTGSQEFAGSVTEVTTASLDQHA